MPRNLRLPFSRGVRPASRPATRRTGPRVVVAVVVGAALAMAVVACGIFGATFTATGPCTADGRAPGAYPDLEARIPPTISGRKATTLDSGRNCSDAALGTLVGHGVHELRFAGGTWDEGTGNGVSIAILSLPDRALPATWIEEFYQAGAEGAKKTEHIETSRPTYPGAGSVFRLDTLNDLSFQTIVVWPDGGAVRVVIVATQVGPNASLAVHDARVAEAVGVAVLADAASPTGSGQEPGASGVLPSAP